ncbi:sugar ABC transporter permease, partial [Pseudomonas sp. BGM005]|nr:sugar ABC transporter permease [Pseudomonas sp. BG5]
MTLATDSTRTIVTGSKSATPTRRPGSSRNREQLISWAFLAPFLIAFALFLVWPIVHGIILSFTD